MRLAVFDTDVIVKAGSMRNSASHQLMMQWVLDGRMQPVISPWIEREYREVAARARLQQSGFQREWVEILISTSLYLLDAILPPNPVPDQKRAPFLGLAQKAGACLVTWSVERFPKATRGGVVVVSPEEYLRQLEKLSGW